MANRPDEAGKSSSAPQSGQDAADLLGDFGRQLRRLYQDTVNEPIPESFHELLCRLEEEEPEEEEGADNGERD